MAKGKRFRVSTFDAPKEDSDPVIERGSGSLVFTVAAEIHYHGGVKLFKGDPITVGSQAKADRMKAAGIIT
jgi:hypothetical protein